MLNLLCLVNISYNINHLLMKRARKNSEKLDIVLYDVEMSRTKNCRQFNAQCRVKQAIVCIASFFPMHDAREIISLLVTYRE
jgi:hypothetical protein